MMKPVLAFCLMAAALLPLERVAVASEPLDLFDSERDALQYCRNDPVVWLDVPSKRYWFKGEDSYGDTKAGGYTCKHDADRAGNRAVTNGPSG